MVNILSNSNSIVNQFIADLRDAEIQKDSLRFRYNLERLGEIFAYEISKELKYEMKEVTTTLGIANVPVLVDFPVLATILRAGLPFYKGFLNMFDRSENAFLSVYRKIHKDHSFSTQLDYSSSPDLNDKVLIITDVMIATGSSVVMAYKNLISRGKPSHTHVVCVLASQEGIEHMKKNLSNYEVTFWAGAVDDELTAHSYIVPGLGDAGDLAFGHKG